MAYLSVNTKAKPLGTYRPPPSDLDINRMRIFGDKNDVAELRPSITGADLEMTIDGASTLTLKVSDPYRGLLQSRLINTTFWVNLDNVEYASAKVSHDADTITLILEDKAVNLMRRYDTPKKANRDNTTRAMFVRGMVNEVKERKIAFNCPELKITQPVASG